MSFVKFAQLLVVEAKVAPAQITRTAMLRDARRHEFDYTPKPGFLYIRSRAISSRTNDNFDTYPAEELRTAYRSFIGKPVFVNHNNEDPTRGRGVVLDAVLHENVAPDGSPDTWVEVLMEVDAIRFPLLAKRILDGDIDRTSMGCNVMSSECSYCGRVATTPDQYCEHIANMKGQRLRRRAATGGVENVLVHEICRGLSFFENSLLVDEPADPTAVFTGIDDSGLRVAKVAAFKLAVYEDLAGLNGKVIQYRKVGTFRVIRPAGDGDEREGFHGYTDERGGWYMCEPIKAPKKYRDQAAAEGGMLRMYVMDRDVIEENTAMKRAVIESLDHGPTEPGPEAATRWEGVVTSGQGYQVVVLWPEYADAMAAMLSGVFKDEERAEEWAQKCRDKGAIHVSIEPPGPPRMYWGSKEADYDEVHRAHPIETLRNQTCPVCKTQNSWDGNICTVCGYVLPPKPFRAPDTDVTGRVDPDEGWFDPDAKKAEPFDPVVDRDTAMKGQKDEGELTMAGSIAAAARQRLLAQQALAAQRRGGGLPRRRAQDESWASPGVVEGGEGTITGDPVPSAEAPSETTEGAAALPDAQNVDVATPGGTGVEDTAPDATETVTDVGGTMPEPAPMDVVDVEAPVSGATAVDPEASSDERPNVDNSAENADGTPLNASDWNTAARRQARIEMEAIRTAVRDRIFASLRLAKLRIAVDVAEHNDELSLAREIEGSRLSNESIANEIKALGLVYGRQRQAMPTAPHRRSARRSPSMAGGTAPLQSLGSGGHDDEALFEP